MSQVSDKDYQSQISSRHDEVQQIVKIMSKVVVIGKTEYFLV